MSVSALHEMLTQMSPHLAEEPYVMLSLPAESVTEEHYHLALATIKEREGITLVIKERDAKQIKQASCELFRLITLEVNSDLMAVGLTAAFAQTLAAADIPCNVFAGYFHDHILVPDALAESALTQLLQLAKTEIVPGQQEI